MKMLQMSCSWAKNNWINLDGSDMLCIKIEMEVQNSLFKKLSMCAIMSNQNTDKHK